MTNVLFYLSSPVSLPIIEHWFQDKTGLLLGRLNIGEMRGSFPTKINIAEITGARAACARKTTPPEASCDINASCKSLL